MVQHEEPNDLDEQLAQETRDAENKKYAEDLRWVMSDKRGRRFMWNLLARTRVYQLSLVMGAVDQTAFNEGKRSVGLEYLADVSGICPERYEKMVEEQKK